MGKKKQIQILIEQQRRDGKRYIKHQIFDPPKVFFPEITGKDKKAKDERAIYLLRKLGYSRSYIAELYGLGSHHTVDTIYLKIASQDS